MLGYCRSLWDVVLQRDSELLDRMLIDDSTRINAVELGWTLLAWAACTGRESIVPVLLKHGADQTLADGAGCTPMMFAAGLDSLSIVQALYTHPTGGPAVANLRDLNGNTAMDHARVNDRPSIVEYLAEKRVEALAWEAAIKASLPPDINDLVIQYYSGNK